MAVTVKYVVKLVKEMKTSTKMSHHNKISKGAHSQTVGDISVLSFFACTPSVGVPLWAVVAKYVVKLVKEIKNINETVIP